MAVCKGDEVSTLSSKRSPSGGRRSLLILSLTSRALSLSSLGRREVLEGKPAERLTNPVLLDVPTIGFGGYASFRALNHPALNCIDPDCALALARRVHRGELRGAIAAQRACVREHLAEAEVRGYYDRLFRVAQKMSSGVHAQGRRL
jgi:hypothetical protein